MTRNPSSCCLSRSRRGRPLRKVWLAALAVAPGVLALLATATPAPAQEYIIHVNGDSINGDVKGFERGKLSFKIPGSSTTYIEYNRLVSVGSSDTWDVELAGQRRVIGTLAPGTERGSVRIVGGTDTVDVPLESIVQMTSIEDNFWSRFDVNLEFGFSFAKANSVTNYTLATLIAYRGTKWDARFTADSRLNSQDDAETVQRNQLNLTAVRLLPKTWYAGVLTQLEQNQELALDLRLLLGLLGGRDIIQSNKVGWRWAAGILSNSEQFTGRDANTSLEGLLAMYFNLFTFGDFENDLSSSLLVYPSLSEGGRWRADFDLNYHQDLFSDFYLALSFYTQFDSDPPEGSNSDYGTSIAIGLDL